jgi:hypothetical protein
MNITSEIEDIVANWPKVRYALQQAALLTPEDSKNMLVYNVLCQILTGHRKIWILHDGQQVKAIVGAVIQNIDGVEPIPSVIISPVFGYSPMSESDRDMLMDGIKDFAKINKCKIIYGHSPNPKAWVVAEKIGMKFVSKVYQMEVT